MKIEICENLINSIANTPKELGAKLVKIEADVIGFRNTEKYAQEAYQSAIKSGVGVAAGVGAGATVAALAPTAAMWVATTFGTASTGTVIASLSGAVATKAALAWLGGGAPDDVIATVQRAIDNTRSIGIGLTACTIPAVGHPNFKIDEGAMEVGIGHHGEPGTSLTKLQSADDIAQIMLDSIIPDLPFEEGDDVAVLISGLGATPVMEQYIVYNKIEELLAKKKMKVYRSYVGNYFTSLEMMGITLTIMKLDAELKELVDMKCESMGLTQFGR